THLFQPKLLPFFQTRFPANSLPSASQEIRAVLTNVSSNLPHRSSLLFRESFESERITANQSEKRREECLPEVHVEFVGVVRMRKEAFDQHPRQRLERPHRALVLINVH